MKLVTLNHDVFSNPFSLVWWATVNLAISPPLLVVFNSTSAPRLPTSVTFASVARGADAEKVRAPSAASGLAASLRAANIVLDVGMDVSGGGGGGGGGG